MAIIWKARSRRRERAKYSNEGNLQEGVHLIPSDFRFGSFRWVSIISVDAGRLVEMESEEENEGGVYKDRKDIEACRDIIL